VVKGALDLKSPTGRTYSDRIDHAKTEKDLSDIYEDMIDSVRWDIPSLPTTTRFAPVGRCRSMLHSSSRPRRCAPIPTPVKENLANELFTRRGSVYFGVAHLLATPPHIRAICFALPTTTPVSMRVAMPPSRVR